MTSKWPLLVVLCCSFGLFGQKKNVSDELKRKPVDLQSNRKTVKRTYNVDFDIVKDVKYPGFGHGVEPVIKIGDELIPFQSGRYIDPGKIKNINVIRKDTVFAGKAYDAILELEVPKALSRRLITLYELQRQHTNVKGKALYVVNREFIYEDPGTLKIDPAYILEIRIGQVDYDNDFQFPVIHLLTKTKENIEKKNTIIIR